MQDGGGSGGTCTGADWLNNVGAVLPNPNDAAPFLTDVTNCKLSQVSWVIPDGNWSDHNDTLPGDGGPSWAAAIVNAVGQNNCTDMVNGSAIPYWQDTVILIVWDDWGGLYDDVSPGAAFGRLGYSNGTGQQYVYGFRVPLLVVSAYAKLAYISGPPSGPNCPNYSCHDFGSILNFIEYVFGTGGQHLGAPYGLVPSSILLRTTWPPTPHLAVLIAATPWRTSSTSAKYNHRHSRRSRTRSICRIASILLRLRIASTRILWTLTMTQVKTDPTAGRPCAC